MFYLELSEKENKKLLELIEYFEKEKGLNLDKHAAVVYILKAVYNNMMMDKILKGDV